MRLHRLLLLTVAGSAVLLGGGIAGESHLLGGGPAFAANGNGNGNDEDRGRGHDERGNGNDEERGNGRDKERGANGEDGGNSNGRSEEAHANNGNGNGNGHGNAEEPTTLASVSPAAAGNGGQSLDARVAGLHAVNANLNAFIHANPNSRVGEIAAYAMAVVGQENAEAGVAAAQEEFDGAALALNEANNTHTADVDVLTNQYGYIDTSPEALAQAKSDLLLVDISAMTPEELAAHNEQIAAVDAAIASGELVTETQLAYDTAADDLLAAQEQAAGAEALAVAALNEAANANRTPVDDEVKLYVDGQLEAGGVLDYYRTLAAPAPVIP